MKLKSPKIILTSGSRVATQKKILAEIKFSSQKIFWQAAPELLLKKKFWPEIKFSSQKKFWQAAPELLLKKNFWLENFFFSQIWLEIKQAIKNFDKQLQSCYLTIKYRNMNFFFAKSWLTPVLLIKQSDETNLRRKGRISVDRRVILLSDVQYPVLI